ncbi:MAG: serine protease, partial [Roseibium sp.]
DVDARVLLISQAGDDNTLRGLYDIMQTLEIVPLVGPRERDKNSFRLIGEDAGMISQTEVRLEDGLIKGFTLTWPSGDEDRRRRVLGEMQKSFVRTDGVLSATASLDQEQRIDLLAGLEIRQPSVARSGFYVDSVGSVVTTDEVVQGCTRITLDDEYDAQLVASDAELGVAVVRPNDPLAPLGIAMFTDQSPRLQSEVALGGYSFGGVLGAPTVTFGKLSDIRGLRGEDNVKRLSMSPLPSDAGGPVLDDNGRLLGMLLPAPENGQNLPNDVSFARDGASIRTMLDGSGFGVETAAAGSQMAAEDLRALSASMTVLVSCWE